MKVWGVFEHIKCEVDGDSETIEELKCLCVTEELAIKRQSEFEVPVIEEMRRRGRTEYETTLFFLGYSHSEIIIEE